MFVQYVINQECFCCIILYAYETVQTTTVVVVCAIINARIFLAASAGIWQSDYHRMVGGWAEGNGDERTNLSSS